MAAVDDSMDNFEYQVWCGNRPETIWLFKSVEPQSITELREKATNNRITHLKIEGRIPPRLDELMPHLTHLYIERLPVDDHPKLECVCNLTNLRGLYLDGNQLTHLPESIDRLANLRILSLTGNRLSEVPESVCDLTSLQWLYLDGNQLTHLPESIGRLTDLQTLFLSRNRLSELPESIGNLTNLKELHLEYNQLSCLPDSMTKLSKLKVLNLSYNHLDTLPSSIGDLVALSSLYIIGNRKLKKLHKSLTDLNGLRTLTIDECDALMEPPTAVCDGGLSEIKQYYKDLDETGFVDQCHCTIAVIGNKMAGKSSFVKTMQNKVDSRTNRSDQAASDETTIVFNFEPVDIKCDKKKIKAKFIDFGGDKIYHNAYQLTFRHHDGLAVFIVKMGQFEEELANVGPREAARQVLAKWVAQIYQAVPDLDPPVLVLTHKDEYRGAGEKERFSDLQKELLAEYEEIMRENSAVRRFGKVFEISYEDDNEVKAWIESFMDYLYPRIEKYTVRLPKSWTRTFEEIKQKRKHWVNCTDLIEHEMSVIKYHWRSGDVLWYPDSSDIADNSSFRDNSSLEDVIFHDIGMVTKVVALFFHHHNSLELRPNTGWSGSQAKGILPEDLALTLVNDTLSVTAQERNTDPSAKLFINLLKAFKLIHGPAPNNAINCYVVPYFMDLVGPPTHSGDVSLGANMTVLGLATPDYAYQQLTVVFLKKMSNKGQVFPYGNGASVKETHSDVHLYHDADSQRINIRVETDKDKVDQAVKTLNEVEQLVEDEMGGSAQLLYEVLCAHCLTLKRPNLAVVSQKRGGQTFVDLLCPEVNLTDHSMERILKSLGVVDEIKEIKDDMKLEWPKIKNYPRVQTGLYRPVIREKTYLMTQTRGRALIINNEVDRDGSQHDYKRLELMLRNFGFVISNFSASSGKSCKNKKDKCGKKGCANKLCGGEGEWTAAGIFRTIRKETLLKDHITKESSAHKDLGMFVLVLMTHGRLGCIKGSDDRALPLLDIYKLLSAKNFPAMAGKPKLLIFQCCSGVEQEVLIGSDITPTIPTISSTSVTTQSPPLSPQPMPSQPLLPQQLSKTPSADAADDENNIKGHLTVDDLLLLKSSFDNYAAKRDKTGSKFIKALVPVFNKFAHCDDVRTLGDKIQECVTDVSKEQMNPGSAPKNPDGCKKKRTAGTVPISICTFTNGRRLYLSPGINMRTHDHPEAFTSPVLPQTIKMPKFTEKVVNGGKKLAVDWDSPMNDENTKGHYTE